MKKEMGELLGLLKEKYMTNKTITNIQNGRDSKLQILMNKLEITSDNVAEAVVEKRIRTKIDNIINQDLIDEALNEVDLGSYIKEVFGRKIKVYIDSNARGIVYEALDDLDEDYGVKLAIRTSTINKIKRAFK